MTRRPPRSLLAIAILGMVSAQASSAGPVVDGRSPANVRQNVTAGRMRFLRTCLDVYFAEHKVYPATLAVAVRDLYPTPQADNLLDAWGRPFLYYRIGTSFFIGSLGRDGLYDGDSPVSESEDCDLAMIDGLFARVPVYVEQ